MARRGPRKLRNLSRSPDGRWRFQMTNPETRERVRVSLGKVSEDEAIAMRDEILAHRLARGSERLGDHVRLFRRAINPAARSEEEAPND